METLGLVIISNPVSIYIYIYIYIDESIFAELLTECSIVG